MSILHRTIVLTAMVAALASATAADIKAPADRDLSAWLGQRMRDWQPTAAERRFDEIGWVDGIRAAERLAKEHRRPVFLFTHDGHMDIGRC